MRKGLVGAGITIPLCLLTWQKLRLNQNAPTRGASTSLRDNVDNKVLAKLAKGLAVVFHTPLEIIQAWLRRRSKPETEFDLTVGFNFSFHKNHIRIPDCIPLRILRTEIITSAVFPFGSTGISKNYYRPIFTSSNHRFGNNL